MISLKVDVWLFFKKDAFDLQRAINDQRLAVFRTND